MRCTGIGRAREEHVNETCSRQVQIMTSTGMYISSVVLGGLGAWIIGRFAGKVGLLDHPNERSSHKEPTPRGGGIGILAAFLFVSIVAGVPLGFWAPAAFVALIGLLTDIFDFSPKVRLPFQFAAGGVFAAGALNGQISHLNGMLLPVLIVPTVIYIVGTANFYNFMDGINGIGGITGIVGFALLAIYLHITGAHSFLKILAISMSLACAGFLPFNMPCARVFMGDVGSILLGFLFGAMVVLFSQSLLDFVCLASFLFPFYADELATMAVRIKEGESLLRPHRRHIYQLLANEKGIAHWKVSVGYGVLQLAVGLGVLAIRPLGLGAVVVFLGVCFLGFSLFGFSVRRSVERKA